MLNKDSWAGTYFQESMSVFVGQVYQSSQPKIDSFLLMKEEGSSKNSKVWKIFYIDITSIKLFLVCLLGLSILIKSQTK